MAHHHHEEPESKVYGVIAEFSDPEEIVVAAHRVREAGYKRMDAYSPYPVHGLSEAIGFRDPRVPWMIFLGGVAGAVTGFGLQSFINAWGSTSTFSGYPMNVGGRPYIPWPSFIPVTFECTILFAALVAVFGTLALNGLPRPYHSIFNASNFDLASQDKLFICVEADDPQFDEQKTAEFLKEIGAVDVELVQK